MADCEPIPTYAPVDLTSCDREPIQFIGAVQPVGFLLAVSPDWAVSHVSANAVGYLGREVDDLLGLPLGDVIGAHALHVVRNRLSLLTGPDAVERVFAVSLGGDGALYDLAICRSGTTLVIEAEPGIPAGELNAGSMVRSMLARIQGQTSLVREAARLVQALTGFDRVMIYRFHSDDTGEVIAERVRSGLEPYLGLRYPAEDIPRQARALLVRNPVRILADTGAEPSPICCRSSIADEPLDLSMSTLRAHSAMHIEYLRNMGVGATMTVSLLRNGKLWGLISCHHMTPRHISFEQRTTAELFAQMLSFLIEQREREELAAYEEHARLIHNQLIAAVIERSSSGEGISALVDRMTELVPCDGVAIWIDGRVTCKGVTPLPDELEGVRQFLDQRAIDRVYATEALGDVYPPAQGFVDRVAGILAIPTSRVPRDYLVFFRQEVARSVTWAGKPGKLVEEGPDGPRLAPRKSFEAWREGMTGHSGVWTGSELRAAESLRVTLLEVVLNLTGMTEKESRAASHKQELLIAELNHRVRNILGLIRSLVTQSRTSAVDVDTFASILGDRVHALARAHDQITDKNWGPGSLATLVATEAGAFLGSGARRIDASGPAVLLQPQAFSTIVLVIHELMTNAAKHGALSGDSGQVSVVWALDPAGDVVIDWTESGGPAVVQPTRRGFGSTIIQRSVPHELGGEASVDFAHGGLHARFVVPARHVVVGETAAAAVAVPAAVAASGRLTGLVLLVEDNMIIALDAEDMLLSLGADEVAVASTVAEALRILDRETPSFALLDVNLGAETSWPIARRLRGLGIRHVFATGYGVGIDYPLEHQSTPSVTKPYTADLIARVLTVGAD